MKILFVAGGTAGHVNPAIATAEAMKKRHRDASIVFVGRKGGEEMISVIKRGYKLRELCVGGLERRLSAKSVKSVYLALKAIGDAKRIIREEKPDAVFATGGYVSWPVLKAAMNEGVPTVLHESNAYPGLVTRLMHKRVTRLLIGTDACKEHLKYPDRAITVGTPLRDGFLGITKNEARRKLGISVGEILIVSFGGSLGSKAINDAVIEIMKSYSGKNSRIKHIHSAGKRYFDAIKSEERELTEGRNGCIIKPYIDDMPTYLIAADITVSRSGALSISELSAVGPAAILIPSPNVADDHQTKNAAALDKAGAAITVKESELKSGALKKAVTELVDDGIKRHLLSKNIKKLHRDDSSENVCRILEDIINIKTSSAP